jgi:hypothetical protein
MRVLKVGLAVYSMMPVNREVEKSEDRIQERGSGRLNYYFFF